MIECLEINSYHPRPDLVHEVVEALKDGKLVACPTDTAYGVFVSIDQRDALDRLTRLRAQMQGSNEAAAALRDKPLAMIFADLTMLGEYVVLSGQAFKLVKRLLPGPYTLILPASRSVPKRMQSRRRHLGARIPDNELVQAIIAGNGEPVLSTSLKSATGELMGDAVSISEEWPYDIDIVIDGGWFVPEPSTVLAVDGSEVTLVRQGKGPIDFL